MRRLLFVDHSYHAKTRASMFLQELLAQHFQLEVLWDESWMGGAALDVVQINDRKTDAIVFFQTLPSQQTLRRLHCTNVTWAPMRDAVRRPWLRFGILSGSSIKILNFCKDAHDYSCAVGQESLCVQYWPPPDPQNQRAARHAPWIFFWLRRREITWETLKLLLGDFRPDRIVLRHAPDPGHNIPFPPKQDIAEYNITLSSDWLGRDEFLAQLRNHDIFMSPRPLEGIGQVMLEAMGQGLAVIAPNAPTMNEYVKDGQNGWLYDLRHPKPLNFDHWASRGHASWEAVARGHTEWLSQAKSIAAFIDRPAAKSKRWDWHLLQTLRL